MKCSANYNQSDKSDKSDKSDNSTPSGKATRDASKRVEECYTDGVKVVTKADKSPPWELWEAIKVYKMIQKKEVIELL